jgi:dihydrofolate reductase
VILRSGEVVRKLLAKELVDELILLIHPLVLGDRQRLFDDGGPGALFDLADTRITTTGVIAATYRRTDHGPKYRAP